ncbi:long-chain fatty acid--CoA ligase [Nocardia uniformis]|uniref:Acyl-CoA synthetase n=1 Tax=Nocardia uniformis TaxID=53432 RepID=A0A849CAT2_9NOCA|nr:long-chain fatty acid--CoA ligase [Nocardia uniformis]NNH72009.1 long-chain fatty acid--CoA ligase [Nocardia uniformis]
MTEQPRSLCAAFQATAARNPDDIALRGPDGTAGITWRQYADRVRRIATGLSALGVRSGDTVAVMLTNVPQFHLSDTAVLHTGATPFSIYNTFTAEQVSHLFANAGNRVVITETQFVEKLRAANIAGTVEHFICVDGPIDDGITLDEVAALQAPEFDFDAAWQAVEESSLLTIVYTSGTTGPPKGVELTHANMLAEFRAVTALFDVRFGDRVVSYLPDAHLANRAFCHYNNLIEGVQITTVADPKQLVATLPQVRPTLFLAVPAIWYKIKAGIEALVAQESPVKRALVGWAIGTGIEVARRRSDGKAIPLALRVQHGVAERLVLSTLRAKMGMDQVRGAITGASPIAPDALAFILGLGIPVCEGWGMTETSAAATLNSPDAIRIGTVGRALPGTEVTVAEDGELLVRGPLIMRGYRHAPEQTAEAVDADGWMHTGDIGAIDADGYIRIVDRKKELIINAAGKNMSPSNIEGAVKVSCPLVGAVVAIGDNRSYVSALLTLDPDACTAYAARHGLADASPAVLAEDPGVRAVLDAGIKEANERLSRVEQIKKFTVLSQVWEPGGDELTPKMSLKRKPIAEKYASEIEALYS